MSVSRRNLLATAAVLGAFAPAAKAASIPKRPTTSPEVWARTELYFGTNRPNSSPITEAEFNGFLDREVTSRFPDGLTLLNGYGQFRSSTGDLVREQSYLLILFYPAQTQNANQQVQEIREAYKTAFGQESVLRVDAFSFVSF